MQRTQGDQDNSPIGFLILGPVGRSHHEACSDLNNVGECEGLIPGGTSKAGLSLSSQCPCLPW